MAGAIERETAMCGTRSRICDDSCNWRPWSDLMGAGECEPGATERIEDDCTPGLTRERRCADDCTWGEPSGECIGSCAREPMPTRTGDPVCIPAGEFVLGTDEVEFADRMPVATIYLSEFYIDRYPITLGRFQQCVDDGGCAPLDPEDVRRHGTDATPDTLLGHHGLSNFIEFCSWDGGDVVSEWQWEKAARGGYPDARRHPWGDDDGTPCMHHPAPECPLVGRAVSTDIRPSLVTEFPAAISPFGVRQIGAFSELAFTLENIWYDELPDRDPVLENTDHIVRRGSPWTGDPPFAPSASVRNWGSIPWSASRCVY